MVTVSSRFLCPFRLSQAGDGKYSALVNPCPCCVPAQRSGQTWSTPQQLGMQWSALQGTALVQD